uniref:Splicing factor, arginine/serine-rich 4/5/6 n=1 Tax=Tetraselmis sp. GSL018 TaxID=582737 RepID=A0A061RQU5_9CHLO|mmetsp:Transcript_22187/g.53076  ORF Transcript_22187/g.53076 Transcript_22187/m.53076 type:complete len:225 (+) Transcript_22187:866-1540(+)
MKDSRDGDDAIRALDKKEFGYQRRRLVVEWARGDGAIKQREETRRKKAKPSSTLFVVNFDPTSVRERDLERHFDRYGRLTRVQIKKNFAFIQYETVSQATAALEACHQSLMGGRLLTVEYVAHEDQAFGPPSRGRSRSPAYGSSRRSRSPPPRRRSPPPRSPPRGYSPPRSRGSPSYRRPPSYSPPPRGRSPSPRRNGSYSRSPPPRRHSPSPPPRRHSPSPDR